MVFSSLVFLCIFLPAVLILHTVIPNRRVRNGLLLAASLIFYGYGEPVYVFLMIISALLNYLFGLWCGKRKNKGVLTAAVIINIGILTVYKYTGFLMESINAVFCTAIPVPEISLPIGISFFTFQALSYVIDVYRGQVEPQSNYAKLLLYISLFPQLIAGPIVRYSDIAREIDERTIDMRRIAFGLRRFIVGLAKKVLIANAMGAVADYLFGLGGGKLNIFGAWIGAIAYLFQIYYDFCGYSDMAIGLGKMFGFTFKENFCYPYIADSIQDFWRRWHISLSSWFRDYVYIPLGGNRKGRLRTVLNRLIIFVLTGLWHGANWTFVIWGLWHGLFLLLEELLPWLQKVPKALRHVYTLIVVTVGFVVFRADTLSEGIQYIGKMFSGFDFSAQTMAYTVQVLTPYFIVMLAAGILACGVLGRFTQPVTALENKEKLSSKDKHIQTATFVLAFLLLVWCIIRLAGSNYNPFIYFRF